MGLLNVRDHPHVAYRYDIEAVPTIMVFQNGLETRRLKGPRTEEELASLLEELTVPH